MGKRKKAIQRYPSNGSCLPKLRGSGPWEADGTIPEGDIFYSISVRGSDPGWR